MKLIFALGNPGPEYTKSRHNIGFMALDSFAKEQGATPFQAKTKFRAEIAELLHGDEKVVLAKPTTFYNLAGQSARALQDFYQIAPEDVLVIHDELALDFGKLRIRLGGSAAGNNGIKSLNAHLGEDYWRLRVGTKNSLQSQIPDADFVLGKFSKNELTALEKSAFPEIQQVIIDFLNGTIEATSKQLPQ